MDANIGVPECRPTRCLRASDDKETTMPTRILFTGGTGKAGRHVLPWLLNEGYQVLNFDGSGSRLGDERANRVDFGSVF
jgi:hypothetical protein